MASNLSTVLTAPNGVKYTQPLGLFINNEWVPAKSGDKIQAIYPADESVIAEVHAAGVEDVDAAVKAARAAFNGPWRETGGTARGALIYKLVELIERDRKVLATIEAWDNGKPYSAAYSGDLDELMSVLKYYAGWADKNSSQVIETTPSKFTYTIAEPIGVCGQIIPWNYPLGMASWKIGPALAAGNTIVMKAAEQTPLSILYLANLVKEAGFPPGVVNIINGYGKTAGAALAAHLDVDKIAFTGSTATGKEIMKAAASNLKNITVETGGKSPLIVFEDAKLDAAVKYGHYGIMGNSGQICTANSRIFVHENVYDKFIELLKEKTLATSILGDPFDEATWQGPQVSKAQHERILSYIQSAKDEGAKLELGGEDASKDFGGKGYYIKPTIFSNVSENMTVYKEEIFGPFAVIKSFKTDEEAIRMANDTPYGLAASLFTENIARAHKVSRKLEAGMVWINSSNGSDYRVPFGGVKQSGIGRECGELGIKAYTNYKSVLLQLDY